MTDGEMIHSHCEIHSLVRLRRIVWWATMISDMIVQREACTRCRTIPDVRPRDRYLDPQSMPQIFDNLKLTLLEGLSQVLPGARSASCCVGHFNLRRWGRTSRLPGAGRDAPPAGRRHESPRRSQERAGDHRRPHACALKRRMTESLKEQLEFGVPSAKQRAPFAGWRVSFARERFTSNPSWAIDCTQGKVDSLERIQYSLLPYLQPHRAGGLSAGE
ncbi:MAG: hypothetical protein KatS3mg082_0545 [Nitrospiraceae bacterium]|nr:MAG: hypothetical protein KatS3mg082_0545 [Nitrospiraceae bacterium]